MSIKITITGDFCPVGRLEPILAGKDYTRILDDYEAVISDSDLNITNLECPIVDLQTPAQKYGPHLSTAPHAVDLLHAANINLVTLANNHIMDHGVDGLRSTLHYLNRADIHSVGAGLSDKAISKPYLFSKGGQRVAIINLAENEFISTKGKPPGANSLDFPSGYRQVRQAAAIADTIILIMHGGNENFNLPSPRFRDTLRFFIDIGCDAVIAHHSHRFCGVETYQGKPIFYGIGNFLFDGGGDAVKDWSLGVVAKLLITQQEGIKYEIVPFLQNFKDHIGLNFLGGKDKEAFTALLEQKRMIIADDVLLEEAYLKFISSVQKQYSHYLQPYTSRYFHKMFSLGWIPSVFKNKSKRLLYQNLIRCESHRDVVLKLLDHEDSHTRV